MHHSTFCGLKGIKKEMEIYICILENDNLEREKILEQSGSDHYVTPLIFGLKEDINFTLREICVALVPSLYVLMLCFCFFSPLHNFI